MTQRVLRRTALVLAVAAALLAGWLWVVLLSPWGYTPPAGLAAIDEGVPHRVFAHGTLRRPLVRRLVIGRHVPAEPAVLPGYRRQGLDVLPQPGARTAGEVFVVDAAELRRLDRYERLGLRYERVERPLDGGGAAWVYRRLPDRPGGAP
jgi:gamma-glutamylcyclotransferase (GGCT)/AIG2-like uncharacterized protein YtfP